VIKSFVLVTFVATFLYVVAFAAGFAVPTRLDADGTRAGQPSAPASHQPQ